MKSILAVIVVGLGVSMVSAPLAQAVTPVEQQFINDVKSQGFYMTSGDDGLLTLGHAICDAKGKGEKDIQMQQELVSGNTQGLTDQEAALFIKTTEKDLCPN